MSKQANPKFLISLDWKKEKRRYRVLMSGLIRNPSHIEVKADVSYFLDSHSWNFLERVRLVKCIKWNSRRCRTRHYHAIQYNSRWQLHIEIIEPKFKFKISVCGINQRLLIDFRITECFAYNIGYPVNKTWK